MLIAEKDEIETKVVIEDTIGMENESETETEKGAEGEDPTAENASEIGRNEIEMYETDTENETGFEGEDLTEAEAKAEVEIQVATVGGIPETLAEAQTREIHRPLSWTVCKTRSG